MIQLFRGGAVGQIYPRAVKIRRLLPDARINQHLGGLDAVGLDLHPGLDRGDTGEQLAADLSRSMAPTPSGPTPRPRGMWRKSG